MVAIPQDSGREYMQVLKGISEYVRIGDNRRRLMEAVEVEDFHLLVKEINDAIESLLFEEITASSLVVVDAEGAPLQETSWPVNPAGLRHPFRRAPRWSGRIA